MKNDNRYLFNLESIDNSRRTLVFERYDNTSFSLYLSMNNGQETYDFKTIQPDVSSLLDIINLSSGKMTLLDTYAVVDNNNDIHAYRLKAVSWKEGEIRKVATYYVNTHDIKFVTDISVSFNNAEFENFMKIVKECIEIAVKNSISESDQYTAAILCEA